MARTVKIGISLPAELLACVDEQRAERGLSRSAFLVFAVNEMLRRERERAADDAYRASYLEDPEDDEYEPLRKAANRALAEESPWE